VCVAAVLGDAEHRVAVLGGREGMPRSLGSVYGGCVTRFLGGSLRGVVARIIDTGGLGSTFNGVAVSRDGTTLLVTDGSSFGGSHAIHTFRVADGSPLRVVGELGTGPLQFHVPRQLWVAPDGFVFVADYSNRVQVLTPGLDFHSFIGEGQLDTPRGVCASADIVVVSETNAHRVSVFSRGDGTLVRRFGSWGDGDGQLKHPNALCFMSGHRHIAVADLDNKRVSVFSVGGEFIRHVGFGALSYPIGVACSAFDELVVADTFNQRVVVFSSSGEVLKVCGDGRFTGVAMHGTTVFAHCSDGRCVLFE
jgi:DNA-binding beta-propeller fold protein YncE